MVEFSHALDYPHNRINNIGCYSCHDVYANSDDLMPTDLIYDPDIIDDTMKNALCWSCHNGAGGVPYRRTHSSLQTDNDYGDWTVECVVCHNPHEDKQLRTHKSASYVVSGVVSTGDVQVNGDGTSRLTKAGSGWTPDAYAGMVLIPNTATSTTQSYGYKIESNTSETIVVEGDIDLTKVVAGNTFAVVYGKLINAYLYLSRITNPMTPQTGYKTVKFFRASGSNSFADGDVTYDGICEVCHNQTTHFRNNGSGSDQNHTSVGAVTGTDCTGCHQHIEGFKPSCAACHDYPPVDASGLVENKMGPPGTGSVTAGVHDTHVNIMGYGCETCHVNSEGSGITHNNGFTITMGFSLFGGSLFGGSYDGQTTANYDSSEINTTVSNNGTMQCGNIYCHGGYNGSGLNATPSWGAPAACGTCHGASNTNPPNSGSHRRHAGNGLLPGTTGSQKERGYACTLCHKNVLGGTGPESYTVQDKTKHVNSKVEWGFDASDSRLAGGPPSYSIASGTQPPSNGTTPRAYGTCSSIYCHSNVQPNGGTGNPDKYTNPAWGTTSDCQGCHIDSTMSGGTAQLRHRNIKSGSHTAHLDSTGNPIDCAKCHNWSGTATGIQSGCTSDSCHGEAGEKTYHANGNVDVVFGTRFGGSYNGTPAPGNGYGNCSNVNCHTDGTSIRTATPVVSTSPNWGSGPLACNACHGNSIYPSPKNGMPDYANNSLKENSHKEHVVDNNIGCEYCHYGVTSDGIVITSKSSHANNGYTIRAVPATTGKKFLGRDVNIRTYFFPGAKTVSPVYGGSCREISCHGSGWPVNTAYQVETLSTYWGHYQKCGDCHLQKAVPSAGGITGQGDVESFTYGDGSHAMIDGDQWRYSGHGKTSGSYDVSNNPAAGFTASANCPTPAVNGCDPCLYCHDYTVQHDKANTGSNPFRLKDHGGANGWNDLCLVCHSTGSSGYDPDGAGIMANKNAAVKVDKYHYGSKHGSGNDGGSLCWDCHDPHGDRVSGSGNIYMVHSKVTVDKVDSNGKPASTASPVFTAAGTGTDYADSTTFNGICNVCHTITGHYTNSSGDGHESGTKCVNCHPHSGNTIVDGNAFP